MGLFPDRSVNDGMVDLDRLVRKEENYRERETWW